MTKVNLVVFSKYALNKVEISIISDILESQNVKRTSFQSLYSKNAGLLQKVHAFFLQREVNAFKRFLTTQDSEARLSLYERSNTTFNETDNETSSVGLLTFNPNCCDGNFMKLDAYYYVDIDDTYKDLNTYILSCVLKRKSFIEISGFEVLNTGHVQQFKISCQGSELFSVSAYRVYSALAQKVIAMNEHRGLYVH